jgi:putative heme-binding domain-containing protein
MSIVRRTVLCSLVLAASGLAQRPLPRTGPIPQKNPFESAQDVETGGRLFQTHCSYCHGAGGEGGRGADLTVGKYRMGGTDPELYNTIRNGVPGSEMGPVRASDDDVWKMVGFVKKLATSGVNPAEKATGDMAAGKALYEKSGCVVCHAIGVQGGSLGPELTDIGRRRGLSFLEESLVKPDADIAIPFRGVRVTTLKGEQVAGTRLNEDDHSIQLRDTADNLRSFLKQNLKEVRYDRPGLMPVYNSLTKKQLDDLVAYMSSLRGEQ